MLYEKRQVLKVGKPSTEIWEKKVLCGFLHFP